MKLEIGMYVRMEKVHTIVESIEQIVGVKDTGNVNCYSIDSESTGCYFKGAFNKASHNIIDLIEVGDYVNGEKVIYKDEKSVSTKSDYKQGGYMMFVDEVKTIVTKERFNSMKFEVK